MNDIDHGINLAGEQYLWDDFAYATREGLIGDITFIEAPTASHDRGMQGQCFSKLQFDIAEAPCPASRTAQPTSACTKGQLINNRHQSA
ncbi:hypothetical protein ACCC96_08305 [Pseudomonas sp. Pseusp11]|uniref:hypothetical protein n=1 Tax=Pseudomonas sp. Pseusp11 TaxID=3243003 RepID=UPI0039B41BED